jgi:hypothetical protein
MNLALSGFMKHFTLRSVVFPLVLVASAAGARAQTQRGVIRGTVNDSSGRPIVGVQVMVKRTDIRATTNAAGRYLLPGVWPGETEIVAQRIGFQLQSVTVAVTPSDTAHVDFVLPDVTSLDAVETDAEATSGRMAAFEQRRARGGGAFITRADIEKRRPTKLSDMLRSVAGVSIKAGSTGQQPTVEIERSSRSITSNVCEVQLYVDGHPYLRGNVDDFPPETVEGMEIYRGGSELPAEYRAQNSGCGLIGIWTRDPSRIRQRP